MTDMTTDLVKRLEAGETGREIEVAIYYALAEPEPNWTDARWADCLAGMNVEQTWHWLSRFRSEWVNITTSLDAAVALCERVRPGCDWSVAKVGPKHRANIWMPSALRLMPSPHSNAPTPAAALIAALLRSMGEG